MNSKLLELYVVELDKPFFYKLYFGYQGLQTAKRPLAALPAYHTLYLALCVFLKKVYKEETRGIPTGCMIYLNLCDSFR